MAAARPNVRYHTILEVLKIENPVVANCLIDQASVETIILIPDAQEARLFMQNEGARREAKCREVCEAESGDHDC